MSNERINLLPPERRRALRRDYFMRLGVVATALVIILLCAAAVLLLPTYVFLVGSADAGKTRLANIESTASSSDNDAVAAQLVILSDSATTLSKLSKGHSVSMVVRDVLAIPRPGISLSGFTYSLAAGRSPDTFTISGISMTRDALRSYQLAIQGAAFASSASMPVSVYAKDSDITFTITVILKP